MSRDEKVLIEKNIELSGEFSRYIIDHPEMDETIPSDAEIVFLPEFDAELKQFNLGLAKDIESAGKRVVYVRIEKLRPKVLSRIEGVNVEIQEAGRPGG